MNEADRERADRVALLRKAAALGRGSFVGVMLHDAANDLDANRPVDDLEFYLTEARLIVAEFEESEQ